MTLSSSSSPSLVAIVVVLVALLLSSSSSLPHASALTTSLKKGVAFAWTSPTSGGPQTVAAACSDLALFNLAWYYNWGSKVACNVTVPGVEYVPMIWGKSDVPISPTIVASNWLLGFNEPNYSVQSNLTALQAAALWPALMATGRKLVGPAVADCDNAGGKCMASSVQWYTDFLAACNANAGGCRMEAAAMHVYVCDPARAMFKINALYAIVKVPIWITEFACTNAANDPNAPTVYATSLLSQLENSTAVGRYGWFISRRAMVDDLSTDSLTLDFKGTGNFSQVGTYYTNFMAGSATSSSSSSTGTSVLSSTGASLSSTGATLSSSSASSTTSVGSSSSSTSSSTPSSASSSSTGSSASSQSSSTSSSFNASLLNTSNDATRTASGGSAAGWATLIATMMATLMIIII